VLDRNPIDVTLAALQPEVLRGACDILLRSEDYDALAVIVGSSGVSQPALMADAIGAVRPQSGKPVIAFVAPHAPDAATLLTQCGVPAYTAAESCASALNALWHASHWRPAEEAPDGEAGEVPLDGLPAGSLDEAQAKRLFARFGVHCAGEAVVETEEEARAAARELGPKVVLKLLSSTITHKSDVGGVALGLDESGIGTALAKMAAEVESRAGIRPQRYLVQQMVAGGTEMILGFHRDGLGAALLLGMGGVTAELYRDTAMRLLPARGGLSREEALAMAHSLKSWPLLDGYRGRAHADIEALLDAIVAFSRMAVALGDRLVEAEINPLLVLPRGRGAVAVDGVAVLAS